MMSRELLCILYSKEIIKKGLVGGVETQPKHNPKQYGDKKKTILNSIYR